MADDPWGSYLTPPNSSPSADPWAQFTKPPGQGSSSSQAASPGSSAPPAPSGQSAQPGFTDYLLQHLAAGSPWDPNAPAKTLGTTPFWDKPADASWGDYMAAHVQPLDDFVRSATNTFGLGDRFAAGMSNLTGIGGGDLAAQKAQSEARAKADPSMAAAGSVVGGLPVSELGVGAKIGETALPYVSKLPLVGQGKWLSGVLGAGTEGVGTAEAGSYGRTGQAASPLEVGVGALSGVPGGVVKGGKLPVSPSAQSYFDQATQEYKPLTNILYDATSEVHPALDITDAKNAQRDWSGKRWDDASKTSDEVEALLDKPQLSANDLQQSQIYLRDKVINSPAADPNDKAYAGYYVDKLQHVLENGTPQTGVPQNLPSGVTPSNYAAYVKSKGDFLTGQAKDMQRDDVWNTVGATTAGKDIGTQAGSWSADQAARAAANKPGVFAPPGSPYFNATEALAKTTGQSTPLSWYAKHFVLAPLAFTAAGEGMNAASGGEATGHQPWWARLGEEVTAGLGVAGGTSLYKGFTGASNVAEQQAAEAALRQTIASRTMQNPAGTYNPLSPVSSPSPLRDTIRRLIYGQTAAGRLPGQ